MTMPLHPLVAWTNQRWCVVRLQTQAPATAHVHHRRPMLHPAKLVRPLQLHLLLLYLLRQLHVHRLVVGLRVQPRPKQQIPQLMHLLQRKRRFRRPLQCRPLLAHHRVARRLDALV